MAIVAEEQIRFAVLKQFALRIDAESADEIRFGGGPAFVGEDGRFAADGFDADAGLRIIADGIDAIVDDVKIERSVAIDIGQGERGASSARIEWGQLSKMAAAIVEEQMGALADGVQHQVQGSIAVQISQH